MRFVVAMRRERRGEGVEATRAGQVPGVTPVGAANPDRVVDASHEAVAEVRRRFGAFMRVEPMIGHSVL